MRSLGASRRRVPPDLSYRFKGCARTTYQGTLISVLTLPTAALRGTDYEFFRQMRKLRLILSNLP